MPGIVKANSKVLDNKKEKEVKMAIIKKLKGVDLKSKLLIEAPRYFKLENETINKLSDLFGPVLYMHAKHAKIVPECVICHHRVPKKEGDRTGQRITSIYDPQFKPTACEKCHDKPFESDNPKRISLKAAYHRRCTGCHEKEAKGPVVCYGCHERKLVDHSKLIKLSRVKEPQEVTKECLRCHDIEGYDVLKTSHWRWAGPTPTTLGAEDRTDIGKRNLLNNF